MIMTAAADSHSPCRRFAESSRRSPGMKIMIIMIMIVTVNYAVPPAGCDSEPDPESP